MLCGHHRPSRCHSKIQQEHRQICPFRILQWYKKSSSQGNFLPGWFFFWVLGAFIANGWPNGYAFISSFLAPCWTIAAFDSCVHISEEASNAAVAVPWAIVSATGIAGLLGWGTWNIVFVDRAWSLPFFTTTTSNQYRSCVLHGNGSDGSDECRSANGAHLFQ